MTRRRTKTSEEIGTLHIEQAMRQRKPGIGTLDGERDALLHIQRARVVALPEPVNVPRMVNGRRLQPWEAGLYVEAMHRVRRRELAMFAGIGPS